MVNVCFPVKVSFYYVVNNRATIGLLLRRTLVRQQFYSAFCPPLIEKVFMSNYFPRQRGTMNMLLFIFFNNRDDRYPRQRGPDEYIESSTWGGLKLSNSIIRFDKYQLPICQTSTRTFQIILPLQNGRNETYKKK